MRVKAVLAIIMPATIGRYFIVMETPLFHFIIDFHAQVPIPCPPQTHALLATNRLHVPHGQTQRYRSKSAARLAGPDPFHTQLRQVPLRGGGRIGAHL